ncbi:DUF1761 domain-containing protein [Kribbella sp. NPDC056345]|uniref:DUF1761 domain-containing protein n=1 Tax=Kribbella sp. NPDC056345 TaxID=3345789 RepID=UPI0035E0818A
MRSSSASEWTDETRRLYPCGQAYADLYDAVGPRLRAAVLHLATAAASSRPKEDAFFRLADWLGGYPGTGRASGAAGRRQRLVPAVPRRPFTRCHGVEINWLAIVPATVVGMLVARFWYGKFFLALWWKLTGIAPEDSKRASRRNLTQLLVANSVTAAGLAVGIGIASEATGDDSVWPALLVGLLASLTFSATTLLQHNAFELKAPKLTFLNISYQLVLFLAMALVIGAL